MQQFTILQRRWAAGEVPKAIMHPVMTLTAPTATDALRIAKQKGQEHPIVQKEQK